MQQRIARLGRVDGLIVAERVQDVLPVRVPVDKQLDVRAVAQLAGEPVQALVLGRVGGELVVVSEGVGVCGSAEGFCP